MHISILSPQATLFEGKIKSAIFPGMEGSFGIQNNHAAITSILVEGHIVLTMDDNSKKKIEIKTSGVLEMSADNIFVLIEE